MYEQVYPSTLPGPSSVSVMPDERRLLAPNAGTETRAMQRDRLATNQLTFIYTFAQAAVFLDWWKEEIGYGAGWFGAGWPAPSAAAALVFHYLETPRWELLPRVGWRVTALVEMRGSGVLPTTCVHEKFKSLASYQLLSGDPAQFVITSTPYGTGVRLVGLSTSSQTFIRRNVAPRRVRSITFKTVVESSAADDSIPICLNLRGVQLIAIVARRQTFNDSLRRPLVTTPTEALLMGGAALTLGVWYQFAFTFSATPGATNCTITRLSDSVVVMSENFSLAHPPITYDSIEFNADASASPCPSAVSDLDVC